MSAKISFTRKIAFVLMAHASRVLPPARAAWGEAMKNEFEHIENDSEAVKWAAGCVAAGYLERSNERSFGVILRKPSAFL